MPPVSVELKRSVKAANDIVDVVAGYLPVTPTGNGKVFKSLCPFHNDTRPSMQIDRQYQNFRCWSCQARGDVFDFVMKFEKVEFPEALQMLARRANIALEPAAEDPQARTRARLLDVMRWAEEKYQHCYFNDPAAEEARKYIGERRLSGSTVREFGLGFAPTLGDWLVRLATDDGVPFDLLMEVGLIGERDENRGYYDRFRERVMFPIRDVRSQTVGFGGRILPNSPMAARGPKYYNSAETPLFHKQHLLYGLDLARHAGAQAGYLAVVEGYTDVMMAHQHGIAQVVATMGTALNTAHVMQLRRYVPKVVLVFDADDAGETATEKAMELFWSQHDFEIGITTLPDGLDPCDLLLKPEGADILRRRLNSAQPVLDYKLDTLLRKHSLSTTEETRHVLDRVLAVLAMAPDMPSASAQMKQELIITRLSQRLGVRQETVWARLGELKTERRRKELQFAARPAVQSPEFASIPRDERSGANPGSTKPTPAGSGPPAILERQLVELLLAEPELVGVAAAALNPEIITHTGLRRMLSELYDLHSSGQTADLDGLRVRMLDRPDLVKVAQDLQFTGRHMTDRPVWLQRLITEFARQRVSAEAKVLKEQLATQTVDEEQAVDLLRRLQSKPR